MQPALYVRHTTFREIGHVGLWVKGEIFGLSCDGYLLRGRTCLVNMQCKAPCGTAATEGLYSAFAGACQGATPDTVRAQIKVTCLRVVSAPSYMMPEQLLVSHVLYSCMATVTA
jgi:hypothetical protein